jgi:hypothetical protein
MGVQSGHGTSLRCPLTTPIGKVFQPLFCGVPPKALPRSTSVKLLESPFFRAVHGLAFVAPREPAFRGASVESKLRPRCSLKGFTAGQSVQVRVVAANDGGEAAPSPVMTAVVG